ncbi:MAG: dimethylsulfonioproprionate lyase family protein [Kiloniellales bacterium]
MESDAELQAMLDAIGVLLQAVKAQTGAPTAALDAALAEVKRPAAPRVGAAAARKPACRHLDRIWALAADGPLPVAELARALRALEPRLAWIQNPNYTAESLGGHYIDNYAYADVLGPRGLVPSDRAAMGFLLLGPGLHYPDHAHAAEEVYLVVAGDSLWRRDAGPWQAKPPGSPIHHPPWTRHATKCGQEPLLAFYLWLGALDTPAQLVR